MAGAEKQKPSTQDMEIALARYFDVRRNLVVPNVSWGFFPNHEADIVVVTKASCLYEVEIKISLADLKADAKKTHGHKSAKVKYLYFAIPEWLLEKGLPHIPEHAGVLVVYRDIQHEYCKWSRKTLEQDCGLKVREHRAPAKNSDYKLTPEERLQVARLGAMRIFGLKENLLGATRSMREWQSQVRVLEKKLEEALADKRATVHAEP